MIDLHCHILPGIDDGSKNSEMSLAMLAEEKRQGLQAITFTPHFHPNRIELEKFLKIRQLSYDRLMSKPETAELGIKFKVGAEVFFSPKINDLDLDPLCFTDSNYILIEFPTDERPYGLSHTLINVINRGYTPIIAHVERYPYFTEEPTKLIDLIEKGCVIQVNAGAVLDKDRIAMKYIKWGMAHIISTDCHNMEKRKPNLKDAFKLIVKKFGEDKADFLDKNARNVFRGRYIDLTMPQTPRKVLGMWI